MTPEEATSKNALTPGGKNRGELVGRYDFQLIEGAVARAFVVAPAAKLSGVTEAIALHVVVRNFDDELGP